MNRSNSLWGHSSHSNIGDASGQVANPSGISQLQSPFLLPSVLPAPSMSILSQGSSDPSPQHASHNVTVAGSTYPAGTAGGEAMQHYLSSATSFASLPGTAGSLDPPTMPPAALSSTIAPGSQLHSMFSPTYPSSCYPPLPGAYTPHGMAASTAYSEPHSNLQPAVGGAGMGPMGVLSSDWLQTMMAAAHGMPPSALSSLLANSPSSLTHIHPSSTPSALPFLPQDTPPLSSTHFNFKPGSLPGHVNQMGMGVEQGVPLGATASGAFAHMAEAYLGGNKQHLAGPYLEPDAQQLVGMAGLAAVEQQVDLEMRKMKRKESNRESARRSRMRKQREAEAVGVEVKVRERENQRLREQVKTMMDLSENIGSQNGQLQEYLRQLREYHLKGSMLSPYRLRTDPSELPGTCSSTPSHGTVDASYLCAPPSPLDCPPTASLLGLGCGDDSAGSEEEEDDEEDVDVTTGRHAEDCLWLEDCYGSPDQAEGGNGGHGGAQGSKEARVDADADARGGGYLHVMRAMQQVTWL